LTEAAILAAFTHWLRGRNFGWQTIAGGVAIFFAIRPPRIGINDDRMRGEW
jgi:hypothetical protein